MGRTGGAFLLILLTATTGCTGWRIAGTSPQAIDSLPPHVRLTLSSGERLELKQARIEADSLVGQVEGDTLGPPMRRAVPTDSIVRVSVRGQTATTRTTAFAGGVAVATAVAGFLLLLVAD